MLDALSADTAMILTMREVAIGVVSLISAVVSLAAGYRKFLQIRRDVEKFLDALPGLSRESDVREQIAAMNARIRKLNSQVTAGPPTTQAPLDEEKVVARWHAARDG